MISWTLKGISLQTICSNLNYQTEICKKGNWKIPSHIGDIIFDYLLSSNYILAENDMNFFQKDITEITKLNATNKTFNDLKIIFKAYLKNLKEISIVGCQFRSIYDNCTNEKEMFLRDEFLKCKHLEKFCFSFTVVNFMSIICEGLFNSVNSLKIIHLDSCKLAVKDYKNIKKLFELCKSIKEIKFSNNTNMVYDNQEIWLKLFKSSSQLKEIHVQNCYNTPIIDYYGECETDALPNFDNFIKLLEKCSGIEVIDLTFNKMTNEYFTLICKALEKSSNNLRKIILSSCSLNDKKCNDLKNLLTTCSGVKQLILKFNTFDDNGLLDLCKGIQHSSFSLTSLDFENCQLTSNQCVLIGQVLEKCTNISSISFSSNDLMDKGLEIICQGLISSAYKLKVVNFEFSELDDIQLIEIGKFFEKCFCLEEVYFSGNRFTENGFFSICQGLASSSYSLRKLILNYCFIDSSQSMDLGRLLMKCDKIENLSMQASITTEEGFACLCQGLLNSTNTLEYLDVSLGSLNQVQAKDLANVVGLCKNLKTLVLNGNEGFGDPFFLQLIKRLLTSSSWEAIEMKNCNLSDAGCIILGKILKKSPKFKSLVLNGPRITDVGLRSILNGLIDSSNIIKYLYIGGLWDIYFTKLENLLRNPRIRNPIRF